MSETTGRNTLIRAALRRKLPGMLEAEEASMAAFDTWDREQAQHNMKRMDAHIGGLRTVLAPLLDAPMRPAGTTDDDDECVFCHVRQEIFSKKSIAHAPDCPVLRRDELLGRT